MASEPSLDKGRDTFQTVSNSRKFRPPASQVSPFASAEKRPVTLENPGAVTTW
jgi:hypothetical protein